MKKILYILFVFLGSLALHSQTDGLRYQTMIIDPGTIELPGANATDFIYPNKPVQLRFSIFSATESLEYQEIQETTTDAYGFVDVISKCASKNGPRGLDFQLSTTLGRGVKEIVFRRSHISH